MPETSLLVSLMVTPGGKSSISRDFDIIFIERLWRSVKYEDVYTTDYVDVRACIEGLHSWFLLYNNQRPHQALNYKTPAEVFLSQQ